VRYKEQAGPTQGVHAIGQVAHIKFPCAADHSARAQILRELNDKLPSSIAITEAEESPRVFMRVTTPHRALISTRSPPARPLSSKRFVWWIKEPLDIAAMQAAARSCLAATTFFIPCPGPVEAR